VNDFDEIFGEGGRGPRTNQLYFGGDPDSSVDYFSGFFLPF